MKVTIITNIPTPYRNPVFEKLSKYTEIELYILFCSKLEPNRNWEIGPTYFNHIFLSKRNTFIHFNFNVVRKLRKINPDILITSGFSPTMIFAWLWSIKNNKKHIPFSDANIHSESHLGFLHIFIRRLVYKTSNAFIGASEKTLDLFRMYHVSDEKLFKSCLAIDNKEFNNQFDTKYYDLMFIGQFIDRKKPLLFVDIAINISKVRNHLRVLLVGTGPLKEECMSKLRNNKIDFYDAGFVQPRDIPKYYQKSRILIFPTNRDPWGLVANEALAAGVPVIISSIAGAANELVIDGYNGYVLKDFILEDWSRKARKLLEDEITYDRLSYNAKKSVSEYNFDLAAEGIINAVKSIQ